MLLAECNTDKKFRSKLAELELPENIYSLLKPIYLPISRYIIEKQCDAKKMIVIGISGAQGSGKSSFTELLKVCLTECFNKKVVSFSIDDFYYSKAKRIELSQTIHPLLITRGVPGTHDVELGISIFQKLANNISGTKIKIPVFDKAIDDLLPIEEWVEYSQIPDIVLFEGWCIGAESQDDAKLDIPTNAFEAEFDKDKKFRQYVDSQLSGRYQDWFARIDCLIMLKIPYFEKVYEWRQLQENKLRKSTNFNVNESKQIMTSEKLHFFIQHFERISKDMLYKMPQKSDITLFLSENQLIEKMKIKDRTFD